MFKFGFVVLLSIYARTLWAYPDFIGHGYKTCVMCHYNSHGSGPLTDYGRALFSQDIAARNFWTPTRITDEDVAEKYSTFIPGVSLPFWVRPAIKYRGLWVETNPGSSKAVTRWINMQRDLDLVLSFDENSRTILVLNYGLLAKSDTDYYGDGKLVSAISREHYFRFYPMEKLLLAVGLMDKVYGLRIGNHTAYSRGAIGLGQDDQAHAVLAQWFEEKWDVSLQTWLGNFLSAPGLRKYGGSMQFEVELAERDRIGASFLTEKNSQVTSRRFGIHNRWGFPNSASSVLLEIGTKQDQQSGSTTKTGSYGLLQSLINLARGYNILTAIERLQDESRFASPELQRWTLGFLMFPIQRTELRVTAVQTKNFSPQSVSEDGWQLQGQIHVSW